MPNTKDQGNINSGFYRLMGEWPEDTVMKQVCLIQYYDGSFH